MKYAAYLLVIAAIIFTGACKKDDNNFPLNGNWILTASGYSIGGQAIWTNAPAGDKKYVQFDGAGNLKGNAFAGYTKYTMKDSVTLLFTGSAADEKYYYKINHDTLIMSPAGPMFCIEGCPMKFVR